MIRDNSELLKSSILTYTQNCEVHIIILILQTKELYLGRQIISQRQRSSEQPD